MTDHAASTSTAELRTCQSRLRAAAELAAPLRTTPLHARHRALGARMVPFAGYDMPVQYPTGILAEHLWTRENAGLFDVSHMGQAFVVGADHETAAAGRRGARAGRHRQPEARPAALHAAPQRRGRHHRRPHGHPLRRSGGGRRPDARRQRRRQGCRLCAHCRAAAVRRAADAGRASRRCWPCRVPRRPRCWPAIAPIRPTCRS